MALGGGAAVGTIVGIMVGIMVGAATGTTAGVAGDPAEPMDVPPVLWGVIVGMRSSPNPSNTV